MTLNGLRIFLTLIKISEKSYNDESDEGYLLEFRFEYPKNLRNLHNDLTYLPERMKIVGS